MARPAHRQAKSTAKDLAPIFHPHETKACLIPVQRDSLYSLPPCTADMHRFWLLVAITAPEIQCRPLKTGQK
jgi:hypothetical protein